ncbi:type VI secretion system Vgr family protein [Oxalobacteraceae bacterium]|nr:type VI secretion system Vgr family protein [Oxalobacteraceae bacterium]
MLRETICRCRCAVASPHPRVPCSVTTVSPSKASVTVCHCCCWQDAELQTDAYGAVRAGAGLFVTSYGIRHGAGGRDPVVDNSARIALLKRATKVARLSAARPRRISRLPSRSIWVRTRLT